jgi:hypothetical protein
MTSSLALRRAERITRAAAVGALAFWLYYFAQRRVLGPLNADEVHFSHLFWMIGAGLRQYQDFYSNALPTYFLILRPFAGEGASNLDFVWSLRLVNASVILPYLAMALWIARYSRQESSAPVKQVAVISLCALVVMFLLLGRMTEIRSDTAGLLLFNTGWWMLLWAQSRASGTAERSWGTTAAAAIAAASILFSARAAVMMVAFAIVWIVLVAQAKDKRAFFSTALIGLGWAAAACAIFLAYTQDVTLAVQSVFFDPLSLMPEVSIWLRLAALDRGFLVTMVVAAFLTAATMLRKEGWNGIHIVVLGATGSQLLLIFFDPSPFQYVYGWSLIPALMGLRFLGSVLAASKDPSRQEFSTGVSLTALGVAAAALTLAMSAAYLVVKGRLPPSGSSLRLDIEQSVTSAELARTPTENLIADLISGRRHQSLANQLRIRSTLCQRLDGRVVSAFASHPICMRDASANWFEIRWPAVIQGEAESGSPFRPEFEASFARHAPSLFIWRRPFDDSKELKLWVKEFLQPCYRLHDGYALIKSRDCRLRVPSSGVGGRV